MRQHHINERLKMERSASMVGHIEAPINDESVAGSAFHVKQCEGDFASVETGRNEF